MPRLQVKPSPLPTRYGPSRKERLPRRRVPEIASSRRMSSTTADLLEGAGLTLEDAGMHELKGLSGGRQLFRLALDAS